MKHENYRRKLTRRRDFLLEKLGCRCTCCGNSTKEVLVFHHLIRYQHLKRTKLSISAGMKMPLGRILEELSICVLVCQHCHTMIHANKIKEPEYAAAIYITEEEWANV